MCNKSRGMDTFWNHCRVLSRERVRNRITRMGIPIQVNASMMGGFYTYGRRTPLAIYKLLSTLNKNINSICKVLVPCFMSWNERSQKCSICTKSLNVVHKFVYIPVSQHFSFAKIIHPPDRCGISKKLIKENDHYTGAPCAGDNKIPF